MACRRSWPWACASALVWVGAPSSGRAEEASEVLAVERVDLRTYDASAAPVGAVLAAPSDLVYERSGPPRTTWAWPAGGPRSGSDAREAWVPLSAPADPLRCFRVEDLIDLTRRLSGGDGTVDVAEEEGREALLIQGPAAGVRRTRELCERVAAALAPSIRLDALLLSDEREVGVEACGSVRLWPGRWARVWAHEHRPRFPVDWEIEIAQESTVVQPLIHDVVEGQELYVRWLPGESLSALEVWSGDLEHLETIELDLTPVRNVPEASGLGPMRAPRTALRRAYTTLAWPLAGGVRELSWRGPGGARRLRLTLSAAPARGPLLAGPPGVGDVQVVRTGAWASGLLFQARSGRSDSLLRELHLLAGGDEVALDGLAASNESLLAFSGPAARFHVATQRIQALETTLSAHELRLRVLTAPEESVRGPLLEGLLRVGQALPAGLAERLRAAGAVEGESVSLPLLSEVKAGFRCGASVPGLAWLDVEVAQQSGGTDPVMGAAFAGLAGEARVTRTPEGLFLALDAELAWADPRGGTVELTMRPPVGMQFSRDKVVPELEGFRRVRLPTLTTGTAVMAVELTWPNADTQERLLGFTVRGSETILLIGTLSSG